MKIGAMHRILFSDISENMIREQYLKQDLKIIESCFKYCPLIIFSDISENNNLCIAPIFIILMVYQIYLEHSLVLQRQIDQLIEHFLEEDYQLFVSFFLLK